MEAEDKEPEKYDKNCVSPDEAQIRPDAAFRIVLVILQPTVLRRFGLGINLAVLASAHTCAASYSVRLLDSGAEWDEMTSSSSITSQLEVVDTGETVASCRVVAIVANDSMEILTK